MKTNSKNRLVILLLNGLFPQQEIGKQFNLMKSSVSLDKEILWFIVSILKVITDFL